MKKLKFLIGYMIPISLFVSGGADAQIVPETTRMIESLSDADVSEYASRYIVASNEVRSGDVKYVAGESIMLVAGFEVKPGATFKASIGNDNQKKEPNAESLSKMLSMSIYPNPASETATIEYWLPKPSRVNIEIVNINGTVVSNPVTGQNLSEGKHRTSVKTQNLPTGIYLCVLNTGDGSRTYKLIKQD